MVLLMNAPQTGSVPGPSVAAGYTLPITGALTHIAQPREPTAAGASNGSLMNARGLMELILVNIGLQPGLIGVGLFSILFLTAVLTTLVASPLFEIVYGRRPVSAGSSVR